MILNFSLPDDFHIRCERHSDFLRFRRCATTWYASECQWGPIWPLWIKGFPQYLPAVTSVVLELMDTLRCHNFYLQVSVPKYGKGDWTLCPACSLTVVIGGHLFSVLGGREERVLAPLQRTDVGPNRSGAAPHPGLCLLSHHLLRLMGGEDVTMGFHSLRRPFWRPAPSVPSRCTEENPDSGFSLIPGLRFKS